MLKQIASVFKANSHSEAVANISTRKKAEKWRDALMQLKENFPPTDFASRKVFDRKIDQISTVIDGFVLNEERARIAEELASKTKSASAFLADATKSLAVAKSETGKVQVKLSGLEERHSVLSANLETLKKKAADDEQAAQVIFDNALLSGDEAAEVAAAEKLSARKLERTVVNGQDNPTSLRLAALDREITAAKELLFRADEVESLAVATHLEALATVAVLDFDRQILPLFDAWQRACFAIDEARKFSKEYPMDSEVERKFRGFRSSFNLTPTLPIGEVQQNLGQVTDYGKTISLVSNIHTLKGPDMAILAEPLPELPAPQDAA